MKTAHFCFQKACLLDRQERICCCSVAACTLSAKESHSIRARFARRGATEPYEHLLLSFRHVQNSHLSDTNRYQATDALPPRDGCVHSDAILPLSRQWQSYRSHSFLLHVYSTESSAHQWRFFTSPHGNSARVLCRPQTSDVRPPLHRYRYRRLPPQLNAYAFPNCLCINFSERSPRSSLPQCLDILPVWSPKVLY